MTAAISLALLAAGCDQRPQTTVLIENDYAPSAATPFVVYRASWQAVSFQSAIAPGSSSHPQLTVPASSNMAYALLAPGWDPSSPAPPTSFVILQSRSGFEVHLDGTLHIPIDDTTFAGNCASGSFLSQAQADFIVQLIFPDDLAAFSYDAATCTTTPIGDAGR